MIRDEHLMTCKNNEKPVEQYNFYYIHKFVLYDWMVTVQKKFNLLDKTLHMAVHVFERFLRKKVMDSSTIQKYGVTAFWIASKYEEIYPPYLEDFEYVCAHSYSSEEFK